MPVTTSSETTGDARGVLVRLLLCTAAIFIFAAVLGLLLYRLHFGLDLSDEVYNAAFVDDWLKGDIRSSTFRMVHEITALLTYPLVDAYVNLTGSTDALFLFLRHVFLLGNLTASIFLFFYVRSWCGPVCAFFAMTAMLGFILGGLPAPTYSHLGLQGLTAALATLGCALTATSRSQANAWALSSAAAWGVTVIAYPTFYAVAGASIVLTYLLFRKGKVVTRVYLPAAVASLFLAAALILFVFSPARVIDDFIFQSAFNSPSDVWRKIDWTLITFAFHHDFRWAFFCALALGLVRPFLGVRITAVAMAALIGCLLFFPVFPAAWVIRSHDAAMIGAVAGLGLLLDLRRAVDRERRVLASLYATSLVAALVTAASSTVGLMAFPTGGFPAAVLAIAATGRDPHARVPTAIALAALAGVVLLSSLTIYSGETPGTVKEREKITWGAAKGLYLPKPQAELVNLMRDRVLPLLKSEDTVLVEGRYSGLGVLLPARTKARSIYMMRRPYVTDTAIEATRDFYADPRNRPDWVVVFRDDKIDYIDPIGDRFEEWYAPVWSEQAMDGTLRLFRRR